jgi:hypothetical protein
MAGYPPRVPPSYQSRDGSKRKTPIERAGSFMDGIISPFVSCWAPNMNSCVPGCGPSPRAYSSKQAALVSPSMDRMPQPPYTESSQSRYPSSPPRYHSSAHELPPVPELPQAATDIEKPHSNDVLCGRGGSSNRHLGNMQFRELVAANKMSYVDLTKKQKMLVARQIVGMIQSASPQGRFLAKDLDTGLWYDIGVPRSLEKTSQALREKNSNDMPSNQGPDSIDDPSSPEGSRSVQSAVEPPVQSLDWDGSIGKTAKSTKNVLAPPLVVPSHLMQVFGPKPPPTTTSTSQHHHWHQNYPPQSRATIEQPNMAPYPPPTPSAPHIDHYRVSPHSPRQHYGEPSHPLSPPHYHHYGEAPSYGHPPLPPDHREHYEHYRNHHDDRLPPPHRGHHDDRPPPPHHHAHPSPPHHHRHPPPSHHHGYPPAPHRHGHPSPPPPSPPPRGPPPIHRRPYPITPARHMNSEPASPVTSHFAPPSHEYEYEYEHDYYNRGQHEYYNRGHPSTPPPRTSANAPPAMCRSNSNGSYIRSKGEVSPERRQEWKRRRNGEGDVRRVPDASLGLSKAMENTLSLNERVVGRARELASPSGVLQSRSRHRLPTVSAGPRSNAAAPVLERKREPQGLERLAGLAALSTAAFLKLDQK